MEALIWHFFKWNKFNGPLKFITVCFICYSNFSRVHFSYVEAEPNEATYSVSQNMIKDAVDISTATKVRLYKIWYRSIADLYQCAVQFASFYTTHSIYDTRLKEGRLKLRMT